MQILFTRPIITYVCDKPLPAGSDLFPLVRHSMVCGRCKCWVRRPQWINLGYLQPVPYGIKWWRQDKHKNTVYCLCERCLLIEHLTSLLEPAVEAGCHNELSTVSKLLQRSTEALQEGIHKARLPINCIEFLDFLVSVSKQVQ